jgi:diadenosine tetraphosphate (Ap4A) HIT family hydrolase
MVVSRVFLVRYYFRLVQVVLLGISFSSCSSLHCNEPSIGTIAVYSFVLSSPPSVRLSSAKENKRFPRFVERAMIPDGSADDTSVPSALSTSHAKPVTTETSPLLPPPPGVDYTKNPTVFGKILQGRSKAKILDESLDFLAFQDIRPRAPLHGLVIPKRYIPTIQDVSGENNETKGANVDRHNENPADLVTQMEDMAHRLLKKNLTPEQYQGKDYILCFHIPPFTSVDHLHLHVLAPASQMQWIWKDVKYNTDRRWCISLEQVQSRIRQGQSAVPYSKTDPWWKILYQVFCPAHGNEQQD